MPMQVAQFQAEADNGHSGVVAFWRLTVNFFSILTADGYSVEI